MESGKRDAVFLPRIILSLFNGSYDLPLGEYALAVLLEALIRIDAAYLSRYPNVPPLYRTGVRYKRQEDGQEDWHDVPTAIRAGVTDCKVLAAWRCAELRLSGIHARPYLVRQPRTGKNGRPVYFYHIQVLWPNGYAEDPSRVLGMTD